MQSTRFHPSENLSTDLVDELRMMIIEGRLSEGKRINEVHLSEALGISRTPLREALSRLLAERALEAIPRRGFFVKTLTIEEVNNIYPIRAILDQEALRLSGIPDRNGLRDLHRLNKALTEETTPLKIIEMDDVWHLTLIKNCGNVVILELIQQFMRRTRRYEYGFMQARRNVENASDIHGDIMRALQKGDLDAACLALKHNMEHGRQPIIEWLQGRSMSDQKGD